MSKTESGFSSWPAELEVVDCHHHLWDLKANYYPWLTDRVTKRVCGEYAAIRRNYLLADFMRDTAGVNLVQSVHVEAVADPADAVKETLWLQSVADASASRGFPHAIVAHCDLGRDDAAEVLERHRAAPNLRGVRQMMHEKELCPGGPSPSLLDNPRWWKNFPLLERNGLSFELQVFPSQMKEAACLVATFPSIQFVLCHTGQPPLGSPGDLPEWREGMRLLASFPNLAVKISGLGMFDRAWSTESLRSIIRETIDIFGPQRCLFASNFPVDGMMSTYHRLWSAYREIVRDLPFSEQRALFADNARRIYRLPLPPRKTPLPPIRGATHPHLSKSISVS